MALLKPEISDLQTNVTPTERTVAIDPESIVSLGSSIRTLLEAVQPQQQQTEVEISPDTKEPVSEPVPTPAMADSGLSIPAQSFLDSIASAEGTGGDYNIIVGGGRFDDYAQHPDVIGLVTKEGPSTAAGKYQITKQTWDYLQSKYSDLTDFSPANQDKAAIYLARERYKIGTKGRDLELISLQVTLLTSGLPSRIHGEVSLLTRTLRVGSGGVLKLGQRL